MSSTIGSNVVRNETFSCSEPEKDDSEVNLIQKKKRAKTSKVWSEFKEIELPDGTKKARCVPSSAISDGRFDMLKMRESVAHWVMIHEHPFSIVEEAFIAMQTHGMPEWERFTRNTCKSDYDKVFKIEKNKLKTLLKSVSRISLTTDLWKSKNQQIEYMVLNGHWIDANWRLHKRVLNFVRLPPRRGFEIANCILKCVKEWGIDDKVYSISVDNASVNDSAITILKDSFSRNNSLMCKGDLFHARCCAHIINLMVQDGVDEIKDIIHDVRESVRYIRDSKSRLKAFGEIVSQLHLPDKKLILDCKTRWNSTYAMLSTARQFKDVFPRYKDVESHYRWCPSDDDWEKVDKVCKILEIFNRVTCVISGSDYPTSNLFLIEVYAIKKVLDNAAMDDNEYVRTMAGRMKVKFDKYWKDCNMLISLASILDPRYKMNLIGWCFPRIYSPEQAVVNKDKVLLTLREIYFEYVALHSSSRVEMEGISSTNPSLQSEDSGCEPFESSSSSHSKYSQYVSEIVALHPPKSDLDMYLEETLFGTRDTNFDVLQWWSINQSRYQILSKMATDILAIPITTVASESTFSAGSRVIDKYRSELAPETVEVILCGGD